MAIFSDLPNEIICIILPFTQPEDLENLAQVERRVQQLALPLLQTHREMIRKYRTLNDETIQGIPIQTDQLLSSDNTLIKVLLKVAMSHPYIGHYIRVLNIRSMTAQYCPDIYTEDEVASIRVLAAESKDYLVPDANVKDSLQLMEDVMHSRRGLRLALLLPLLPNLKVLNIKDARDGPFSSWSEKVILNAPRAARPVLTKLAKIQVRSLPGNGPFVGQLLAFAALPSVKELSASNCHALYQSKKAEDELIFPASGVTKLELCDSALDSKTLCSFLRCFGKLQTLLLSVVHRYTYLTLNASLIKDVLLAHTKTTLHTLTILGPPERFYFMGSLRDFEVLTRLHTHWQLLIPTEQAQLSAVLPGSLCSLWLNDTKFRDASTYQMILRDTLSDKQSGLLHLEDLTFITPESGGLCRTHLSLQQDCREKGLDVTFSHEHLADEGRYPDLLQRFQPSESHGPQHEGPKV